MAISIVACLYACLCSLTVGVFLGVSRGSRYLQEEATAEFHTRLALLTAVKSECCRNCKVRIANALAADATAVDRSAPTFQSESSSH